MPVYLLALAYLATLLVSLGVLVWSADRLVTGAAVTARRLGVASMVVGLTIVALGTSAPELVVSTLAALDGKREVAVGNAIGSNITNVGLALGVTALLAPIAVASATLRREMPVLFAIMALATLVVWNTELHRLEGALLLAGLAAVIAWIVRLGLRSTGDDPISAEYEAHLPRETPLGRALFWLVAGLVALLVSSRALIWSAVGLLTLADISELVIGLSVVALGTSLPEIAASIAGVAKKEPDIAVGNVVGSNMFNLLGVLGLPALLAPGPLPPEIVTRDFPVMIAMTAALYLMCRERGGGAGLISRANGALLLAAYVGYQLYIYYDSVPA